jgi:hypothetical protein
MQAVAWGALCSYATDTGGLAGPRHGPMRFLQRRARYMQHAARGDFVRRSSCDGGNWEGAAVTRKVPSGRVSSLLDTTLVVDSASAMSIRDGADGPCSETPRHDRGFVFSMTRVRRDAPAGDRGAIRTAMRTAKSPMRAQKPWRHRGSATGRDERCPSRASLPMGSRARALCRRCICFGPSQQWSSSRWLSSRDLLQGTDSSTRGISRYHLLGTARALSYSMDASAAPRLQRPATRRCRPA